MTWPFVNTGLLSVTTLPDEMFSPQKNSNSIRLGVCVALLSGRVKKCRRLGNRGIQSALQAKHPASDRDQTTDSQHTVSPEWTTAMTALSARLIHDEDGFIVSAELVLIATVGLLAMVVGLSEVALNINNELEDIGSAFGSVNQSFLVRGSRGHQGSGEGGRFQDSGDYCDRSGNISPGSPSHGEN